LAQLTRVREETAVRAHLAEARPETGDGVPEDRVELARIGLPRERDRAREAELLRDEGVEPLGFRRVAREELDEARLGPRRALRAETERRVDPRVEGV